ncbi:MAG: zinc-ribbon domain-containing protein [Planctomycetota bacterium]|nr:MAG: zinc-ribbon domain-containing protein [Planctomycetota bacterium]
MKSERKLRHPRHQGAKSTLRVAGFGLLLVGGIFALIGFVDFFSSFNSMGPPTKFWCLFVGLPLAALGLGMVKAGYMGEVSRYVAGETAPVLKDTFNYMAEGTQDGVEDLAEAVGRGLHGSRAASQDAKVVLRCHKCNQDNDADSRFCKQCGASLAKSHPCSSCGELNDPDARFCDHCGQAISNSST